MSHLSITLIQNKKIHSFPLVLIDKEYFKPLMVLLENMVYDGMIDKCDMDLILLTDSVQEAIEYIDTHAVKKFGPCRLANGDPCNAPAP